MNYGKKIKNDGTIQGGHLVFISGRKVCLSAAECAELDIRLKMERATGRSISQDEIKELQKENESLQSKLSDSDYSDGIG